MRDAELIRQMLSALHNATGAYVALKDAGLDKHLPGYEHTLKRIEAAIKAAEVRLGADRGVSE